MRRYMLDTNMVSYLLKKKSAAAESRILGLSPTETVCISTITEAELLYGIAKSGAGPSRRRQLSSLFALLHVLPWDSRAAAAYAELRVRQEAMGRTLSPYDMQIAAHALSVEAYLVTADKAFTSVSGLAGVENWATDIS